MTRNNAKAKHRRLQACARLSPAGFAAPRAGSPGTGHRAGGTLDRSQ